MTGIADEADGAVRAASGGCRQPRGRLVCPGCGGKKTSRAQICASCRRTANAVGVSIVTHVHEAAAPVEARATSLRSPQQSRVYHAKCNDLAKLNKVELRLVKKNALAHAARMFGRPFESSTELNEIEMELLLEWLDDAIEEARTRAQAPA